jgi:hypothetical protein
LIELNWKPSLTFLQGNLCSLFTPYQTTHTFGSFVHGPLHLAEEGPPITLIHGPLGVGRSFIWEAFSDAVTACGRANDNTVFDSIHVIDMQKGVTTCIDTGFDSKQQSVRARAW